MHLVEEIDGKQGFTFKTLYFLMEPPLEKINIIKKGLSVSRPPRWRITFKIDSRQGQPKKILPWKGGDFF